MISNRVYEPINASMRRFASASTIVTTSLIIRLRTEDRLLAVRRIYRCPPTAAVSSDHDAITPVLFILGSHWSMSLARPGSRNRHQEELRQCVLKVLPPQTALHGRPFNVPFDPVGSKQKDIAWFN